MDITELYDQLATTTSDDWREVCDELAEAGYTWEWTFHRDGSDEFLLTDAR